MINKTNKSIKYHLILERILFIVLVPCLPFFFFWHDFVLMFLTFFGSFIFIGLILLEIGFYLFAQKSYFLLYCISIGLLLTIIYIILNINQIPTYRYWQIISTGIGSGLFYGVTILFHSKLRKYNSLLKNFNDPDLSKIWFYIYIAVSLIFFIGGVFFWLINSYPSEKITPFATNTTISLNYFRPVEHTFPAISISFKNPTSNDINLNNLKIKGFVDDQGHGELNSYVESNSGLILSKNNKPIKAGFHDISLFIEALPFELENQQVTIHMKRVLSFKFVRDETIYKILRLWIYWPTLFAVWLLFSTWIILRIKNN